MSCALTNSIFPFFEVRAWSQHEQKNVVSEAPITFCLYVCCKSLLKVLSCPMILYGMFCLRRLCSFHGKKIPSMWQMLLPTSASHRLRTLVNWWVLIMHWLLCTKCFRDHLLVISPSLWLSKVWNYKCVSPFPAINAKADSTTKRNSAMFPLITTGIMVVCRSSGLWENILWSFITLYRNLLIKQLISFLESLLFNFTILH